jgi:hypothetical protein
MLAYFLPAALLASRPPTTVRTSAAHLALRARLHPVLAWPLCVRGSLPLRALSLGRRRSVFPIYPIVVSDRLHLDIGDIVVGHVLLDGFDRLDQPVWAPDCGHGGGDTTARLNSDGKFEKYRPAFDVTGRKYFRSVTSFPKSASSFNTRVRAEVTDT